SRALLQQLPIELNSDDFVFDNEIILQAIAAGARIGEVSCPTRYEAESSSVDFRRSVRYGLGVVRATVEYRLDRWGLRRASFLASVGEKVRSSEEQTSMAAVIGRRARTGSRKSS